jgi:uroporphyrinogen decarboxylase
MNSKQRVLSALRREGYDRIPVKHEGTPEVNAELMAHFGISNYANLLAILGDDFRSVGPAYIGPELRTFPDGSWEGWWGERYNNISFGEGTYPEAVYLPYANLTDVAELRLLRAPDPNWFDYTTVRAQCEAKADYAVIFGSAGMPDFINGIARCRGVEQVLADIATEDPIYLELVEQRFAFFYEMAERTLQAAGGLIDIVHTGDDFGTQKGLLISPRKFDRIFAKKYAEFFSMAHRYGARTMMHSCGSVRQLIPRLIDVGLDILDVVQVGATGMGIRELHAEFGDRLNFCGSMDVQATLPFGTVADVEAEVDLRLDLFRQGGMFLGPTHAIQVGTPIANTLAMYRRAGSLADVAAAADPMAPTLSEAGNPTRFSYVRKAR